MSHGKTLILGLGSDALCDDGLPVRLVEKLKTVLNPSIYDFGSSPVGGLELIDLLKDYRKAILIDTLLTGRKRPGTIILFTPGDHEETFHISSQHDLTFNQVLNLAKELEIQLPDKIFIIAIEIAENKLLSFDLSEQISDKLPELSASITNIISSL